MANNVATVPPDQTSQPIASPNRPAKGLKDEAYLVYPRDMADDQDRIKFTAKEILKSTATNSSIALQATTPTINKVSGIPEIFLPIQSGISDQNSVNWGAGELNELQKQLVNASIRVQRSGNNLGDVVLSELQNVSNMFRDVVGSGLANIYFAEQAVGVQGLLSRVTGNVLNPNLELLFQGPTLRPFQFQFRLSSRNQKEAETVKKIIKFFKQNMAVQRESTGLFLKAPYVFGIQYQKGVSDQDHPSIGKIKDCALQSCVVDYTPLGSYMTFNDEKATMVSYNISLQFQEIIPIYWDEYLDNQNDIGF